MGIATKSCRSFMGFTLHGSGEVWLEFARIHLIAAHRDLVKWKPRFWNNENALVIFKLKIYNDHSKEWFLNFLKLRSISAPGNIKKHVYKFWSTNVSIKLPVEWLSNNEINVKQLTIVLADQDSYISNSRQVYKPFDFATPDRHMTLIADM